MDIGSKHGYPSGALSNFAPRRFEIDGVQCNSIEGFLQSLKFANVDMQEFVCTLVGLAAKRKGRGKKWWTTQTLWWKGQPYKRDSKEYQELLFKAYYCVWSQDKSFHKALVATNGATLTHSIGKNKINQTILTEREFISFLNFFRSVDPNDENNSFRELKEKYFGRSN